MSAKRHALHTDASHRFESGVDGQSAQSAVRRALCFAQLLWQTKQGASVALDIRGEAFSAEAESRFQEKTIVFPKGLSRRDKLLHLCDCSTEDEQCLLDALEVRSLKA